MTIKKKAKKKPVKRATKRVAKSAIAYYIRITKNHRTYYKIGITSNSVYWRFSREKGLTYKMIFTKAFSSRKEAYAVEQAMLKRYAVYRAWKKGDRAILSGGGNSEIFTIDVINSNKDFFEQIAAEVLKK